MLGKVPRSVFALVGALVVLGAGVAAYLVTPAPSDRCSGLDLGLPSGNRSTGAGTIAAALAPENVDEVAPPAAPIGRADVGPPIPVVAAENFWGSLVTQLGGNQTAVLSIVSDPNADPHEYEANASDARAMANAQLVVVNGVGYDAWALDLIASDGNAHQIVLNVGTLNQVELGGGIVSGNPHLWYNPSYVDRTIEAIYSDLVAIRPAATTVFQANYAALNASLGSVYARADAIRTAFAGTPVAATEDIFVYLANYTHLDLVSPPTFMEAIAQGNDPSSSSVVLFECQLASGRVHTLVYNQQTISPTTTNMQAIATSDRIPIVGITETIQPPGATFQVWMDGELRALQNALSSASSSG